MLHDRRKRHGERSGKLADGNVLVQIELRQQRAARRIGKRGKGAVERDLLTLNHMVKCKGPRRVCQPARCSSHRSASQRGLRCLSNVGSRGGLAAFAHARGSLTEAAGLFMVRQLRRRPIVNSLLEVPSCNDGCFP